MKRLLLMLALLWPLAGQADFAAGMAAYERGDFTTAMREWRPLAEAVNWYRKAAGQGFADAQAKLGVIYLAGESVREDYVQGYAWLTLAAAQGNNDALQAKRLIGTRVTPAQVAKAQELSETLCTSISGCTK